MSLIEEALRKQREETEQAQGSAPKAPETPPPETPPDAEETPAPEAEAPAARRPWRLLAIIGGVTVLVIIGLAWLLLFGLKMWNSKPKAPPAATATTGTLTGASAPVATNAVTRVATNAPAPVAAPKAATTPVAPAQPPPPAPASNVVAKADTTTVAAVATTTTRPPVMPTAPAVAIPAPVEPEPVAPWPKLTVAGFISKGRGAKGAAIVNGQVVGPGDVVEGVKIIAVEKQGVLMGLGGQTQTVVVGGTTE
jgi:hypothetical protein